MKKKQSHEHGYAKCDECALWCNEAFKMGVQSIIVLLPMKQRDRLLKVYEQSTPELQRLIAKYACEKCGCVKE